MTVHGQSQKIRVPTSGGGASHAYIGYNTVGGSVLTMAVKRVYATQVVLATDGYISSIAIHADQASVPLGSLTTMVFTDNAGSPYVMIFHSGQTQTVWNQSGWSPAPARWFATPGGVWVPAGTYWLGAGAGGTLRIYYDAGTGSDFHWDGAPTPPAFTDAASQSPAGDTNAYSIRADFEATS